MIKRPARSQDPRATRAAKAAAGRSVWPVVRLFGVAGIACVAAGAAMLMYPRAEEAVERRVSEAARPNPPATASIPQKPGDPVQAAAAPPTRPASAAPAPPAGQAQAQARPVAASGTPAAFTVPVQPAAPPALPTAVAALAPVAPEAAPPPPAAGPAPVAAGPSAPAPEAATPSPVRLAGASLDCVAPELVGVLQEVQKRFGPIEVLSGKEVRTRNHGVGTGRHKLHGACKAVDFKVQGKAGEIAAFLKSRPEVNGIGSYRDGIMHIDLNERRRAAQAR